MAAAMRGGMLGQKQAIGRCTPVGVRCTSKRVATRFGLRTMAASGRSLVPAQPAVPVPSRRKRLTVSASAAGAPGEAAQPASNGYSKAFENRRLVLFAGLLLGYTALYLVRGSLTFTAPVMVADSTLEVTKANIGTMTSLFPLAYGLSKFNGGVLTASFSPRLMLAYALFIVAGINLVFGFNTSVFWWCVLWTMSGGTQGVGAPSCATILTRWFAAKERGVFWGMWNIGTNIGGFLSPIIVGGCAKAFGWRWGMWAPAIIAAISGVAVLLSVRDRPEDLSFPPVEKATADKGAKKSGGESIKEALGEVVRNKSVWLLAVTYFFVYMVRQGATSWTVFYLLEAKGAADVGQATLTVSGLELGGLAGGLSSGAISDWALKGLKKGAGVVGKRVQIVMAYTVFLIGALFVLKYIPAGAPTLQWLSIAAVGFGIYGPQMLIGLCGAELVSPNSVGSSQGVLGLVSYLGAANAGIPLAWLQSTYGWNGFFLALVGAALTSFILISPLANAKSFVQKREEAKLA